MIDCCVLMAPHPMLGVDYHDVIPPPPAPPTPVPMNPYFVMQLLTGLQTNAKYATKTYTMSFPPMHKGTDIGYFIGHVGNPVNIILPVIILFSGSSSLFGASTVQIENKEVATACFVFANQNLNCCQPCSMPTGSVCAPNTVMAGMTFGDFLGGALNMAAQIGLSYAIGKALGPLNNKLDSVGSAIAGRFISNAVWKEVVGRVIGKGVEETLIKPVTDIPGKIAKYLSDEAGSAADAGIDAISDLFNDPAIEEVGDFPEPQNENMA